MRKDRKIVLMLSRMDKERKMLARTGLVLQGTVTEINISRDEKEGRRKYGPYYQWTFKRGGKTVTINLSASQKNQFRKAILNNRMAEAALERMRTLSKKILDSSTPGVKRRKKK